MANLLEIIKNIDEQIEVLQKQLDALKKSRDILTHGVRLNSDNASTQPPVVLMKANNIPVGYKKEFSIRNKVLFFIKQQGRFIHIREIANLVKNAGGIYDIVDDSELIQKLSPALSRLKKDGILINYVEGKSLRNTFWGSKKWLNENGQIKTGYEFDRKQLKENESQEVIKI